MNYHYPPEKNERLRQLMKMTKAQMALYLDRLRTVKASEVEASDREKIAYNNGAADAAARVRHVVPAARALMEHIIGAISEIAPDEFTRREVSKNLRKNFDGYFEIVGARPSEVVPETEPLAVKWRTMDCAPRDGTYFLVLTQTQDSGTGKWSVGLDCIPKGEEVTTSRAWASHRAIRITPQWWAPFSPPDGSKLEKYGSSWPWVCKT